MPFHFRILITGYCQNLEEFAPISHNDSPTVVPKFVSRGHLYKAIVGDTIELPCKVQNLGKYTTTHTHNTHAILWRYLNPSVKLKKSMLGMVVNMPYEHGTVE